VRTRAGSVKSVRSIMLPADPSARVQDRVRSDPTRCRAGPLLEAPEAFWSRRRSDGVETVETASIGSPPLAFARAEVGLIRQFSLSTMW